MPILGKKKGILEFQNSSGDILANVNKITASQQIKLFCASLLLTLALSSAALAQTTTIMSLDLSKSFHTRSLWSLQATQGPEVDGAIPEDKVDGVITLCLRKGTTGACDPDLATAFNEPGFAANGPDIEMLFGEPHHLEEPLILYPEGAKRRALLWVETSSESGVDGNHGIFTQVLAYNRTKDRFYRIYSHLSDGSNNNQDIRFIDAGPLRGDIISVEPTNKAPFAFWIVVNALTPSFTYREVLRYRSATRYNDGNPLSVIDSDMLDIQKRLGLWHDGMPLPLPASGCIHPQMIHDELWCR
jgi:hypothetical protein